MPQDQLPSSPQPHAAARAELADFLRSGGISVAFQPILSLESGATVAYEALTRPPAGASDESAETLFSLASRAHRVPDLDRHAHALALAGATFLGAHALLFINAAPASVSHPDFTLRLARLASHAGIAPRRLVIELTEQGDGTDGGRLEQNLADLRSLGFGIALDDVGAGHSDLRRILRLRPGWLKLDRSIVQRIDTDPYGRSLLAALLRFAAHNGVKVVAEGIELPSQARAASDMGITHAQGYWFARPGPLGEVISARCHARVARRWRTAALAASA